MKVDVAEGDQVDWLKLLSTDVVDFLRHGNNSNTNIPKTFYAAAADTVFVNLMHFKN